jgi:flagellar basal body-associated protein FliL
MEASAPEPNPVAKSNKTVLIVLGSILAVVAIGLVVFFATRTSKEEKALQAVCTARADIKTQVNNLASTNVSNFTVNGFKASVNSIRADLQTIKDNQADLGKDRKAEIQQANSQFTSSVTSTLKSLGTSLSINNAQDKLKQVGQGLISAYQSSLEPVDCTGVKLNN